jgi:glycosyltransferase involved in cell wall biosynthesis
MPRRSSKTGVLFVNSPEWPGADTFIHTSIMRGLDRSRYEVHVACAPSAPGAQMSTLEEFSAIPDLRVRLTKFGPSLSNVRGPARGLRLLREALPTVASYAGLARYIRKQRIAVLHATDRPRDAVSCVLLSRLTGAKSVVHVHVKCAEWMGRSVRWAFGQADALVGVSDFVARSLVDNGYAPTKTHAVLNAIDIASWDSRLDGSGVRSALGIPPDALVIACAARLFRGKGQDHVIRALAEVRRQVPAVRLLVIGEDDRQAMQTSFRAELQQLVTDLSLSREVIFTGHRSDMPSLMAASDVFALASREEPFGLVYLEAMAMKKPVVALASGGTLEIIEHGKSGLLSTPGDEAAFAADLITLLRDPAMRRRMGEYGRLQVETRFTPGRMARDTEDIYDALLK